MSAIERWAEAPPVLSEERWGALERQSKVLANTKLVHKHLQGNPDAVMAVAITIDALGMPVTLPTINQFYCPADGQIAPMTQLMVGMLWSRGHELRRIFGDEHRATVSAKRRGTDRWEQFTFTIDQAQRAGLLDQWVERKYRNDGDRYDRNEKFVLDREGVDQPDWVVKERRAGRVKRKDNWHLWREDMLYAAAVRRACRTICPDVLLGLPNVEYAEFGGDGGEEPAADSPTPPVAVATEAPEVEPEDDDIVDGELVDDEDPAEEVGGADAPDAPEPADDLVSKSWRSQFAIVANEAGLTADHRHAIISHATNGRTATSTQLRRSETAAVVKWFRAVTEGDPPEFQFVELDGGLHIGPRSHADEASFKASA